MPIFDQRLPPGFEVRRARVKGHSASEQAAGCFPPVSYLNRPLFALNIRWLPWQRSQARWSPLHLGVQRDVEKERKSKQPRCLASSVRLVTRSPGRLVARLLVTLGLLVGLAGRSAHLTRARNQGFALIADTNRIAIS